MNKDIIPDKNKNLFNFSNITGLIKHIQEISSIHDLDILVSKLSTLNGKIYPSFYRSDKIFFKNEKNKKQIHQERKLYLEDKKAALICQIKNKTQSIYASKIFTEEEINTIFNYSSTSENSGWDSSLFNRGQGKVDDGYFIQISADDFSNDVKMCQLFEMLPGELLGEFIIQQTDDPLNIQAAQDKFFEEIEKLKIHDLKFKGHLDSRFSS